MPETNPPAGAMPVAGGATPPQTPPAPAGSDTPPTPPPAAGDQGGDDDLGKGGRRALEAERVARREAEARARTAQEELTKLQNANLSESEKRDKRLADYEAKEGTWAQERQELLLAHEVERQAAKAGFAQPELAMKLLDRSAVTFKADGRPENVDDLLKALIKTYPNLAGGAPSGDFGAGGGGSAGLTRAEIEKMGPDEINRRWPEVQAAMNRR